MQIETRNVKLLQDFNTLDAEVKKLRTENTELLKQTHEQKEQLRVLNENLRRETEVGVSREKECRALEHESRLLKEMLEEVKS